MAPVENIQEAIVAANKNFMATFGKGDSAGIAKLYTENGQLLPPNADFAKGRKGIQGFWQAVMDMGIKAVKLESVEVEHHGDTANEVGKYTLGGAGGQVMDQGKYVVIWKKEGAQWKLHRDIWNTSMPAPGT